MNAINVVHMLTRFLYGGAERRVADAIAALPEPEYAHTLVVGGESRLEIARAAVPTAEVLVVRHLRRSPHPVRDARALTSLVRLLRARRVDVLHTCHAKAGVLGRAAGRITGVPVVMHSISAADFGPGFGRLASVVYRTAERAAARWTDAYFVAGSDLRSRFLDAGIGRPEQYRIVRAPMDVAALAQARELPREVARRRLGLDSRRPLVGYVGRLEAVKGVLDLPDYLVALRASGTPARLVIAGEGELRPSLEALFAQRGLAEDVVFTGYTPRVSELLRAVDCVVLPSCAEGLPQVLVQAAAVGTPFVAYEVDGARELLDRGATGSVVEQGAVEEAARASGSWIERHTVGPLFDLREWHVAITRACYRSMVEEFADVVTATRDLHALQEAPAHEAGKG
jgi:glycosyltransferase involved in cell wall biosynthesis